LIFNGFELFSKEEDFFDQMKFEDEEDKPILVQDQNSEKSGNESLKL